MRSLPRVVRKGDNANYVCRGAIGESASVVHLQQASKLKTSSCPSNPSSGILFRPAQTEARSLLLGAPQQDWRLRIPFAVIKRRLNRKTRGPPADAPPKYLRTVCNRDQRDDLIAESCDGFLRRFLFFRSLYSIFLLKTKRSLRDRGYLISG